MISSMRPSVVLQAAQTSGITKGAERPSIYRVESVRWTNLVVA